MKSFHRQITIILLTTDSLSLILALNLSYFLRSVSSIIQPFQIYLSTLPFTVFLLISVFYFNSLYGSSIRINKFNYLLQLIKTLFIWFLILMSISYLIKYDFSRILLILTFLLTSFFIILTRLIILSFEISQIISGNFSLNILIVGAGRPARDLARKIKMYNPIGYRVIGFIDDHALERPDFPLLAKFNKIPSQVKKHHISEIFIINPSLSHQAILNLSEKCLSYPVNIRVVSNVFNLISGPVDYSNPFTVPSLNLYHALHSWWNNIPKQIFDLISAVILLFIFSPILIVIACLIIILDRTHPLFTQSRIGKNSRQFTIYKFNTMKHKKITPLGRFLRHTSLDELPQLINIIKGSMSLVGPRPELPSKVNGYNSWQKKRFLVKPGLTGLWQILGRKDLPLQDNLEYDFYYISNLSLKLDLEILLKTLPAVISQKGAY